MLIQSLMCFQTKRYYEENKMDIYFVLFVGQNYNNENKVYVLEIKNGISQIKKRKEYSTDFYISSGVHLEFERRISMEEINNTNCAVLEFRRHFNIKKEEFFSSLFLDSNS